MNDGRERERGYERDDYLDEEQGKCDDIEARCLQCGSVLVDEVGFCSKHCFDHYYR